VSSLFTLRSLLAYRGVSRPALEAFRDARLREVFRHAWERVPYYRRRFERHGLGPDDVRGVADLAALPITCKEDVQGLPADSLDTYRERVTRTSLEDLQRQARERLHPERAAIVVVGPAEALVPALEGLGPVRVVQP